MVEVLILTVDCVDYFSIKGSSSDNVHGIRQKKKKKGLAKENAKLCLQ